MGDTKSEQQPARVRKPRRHLFRHKDVNCGAASFAAGLNGYKLIWIFIIGCVIGVAFETFFVWHKEGEYMRCSGMLYGPFNQVYGMGAVLFTLCLYRFRKKNAIIIFLASAVLGGLFEYACSWAQQMLFGSVSWEYSHMPANLGGRTNLFYAFGWGVMGLLFITHIWPFLSEMIERIPNRIEARRKGGGWVVVATGKGITIALAVLLAADLALTGLAVFRAGRRAEGVAATNGVSQWLDAHYPDSVMREKFPTMEFVDRFAKSNPQVGKKAADTPQSGQGEQAKNGARPAAAACDERQAGPIFAQGAPRARR